MRKHLFLLIYKDKIQIHFSNIPDSMELYSISSTSFLMTLSCFTSDSMSRECVCCSIFPLELLLSLDWRGRRGRPRPLFLLFRRKSFGLNFATSLSFRPDLDNRSGDSSSDSIWFSELSDLTAITPDLKPLSSSSSLEIRENISSFDYIFYLSRISISQSRSGIETSPASSLS